MKKLVKSWQQLLQARTPNGVPPTPHTSTPINPLREHSPLPLHTTHTPSPPLKEHFPSPVKHDASKLTITSSTPQSIKELFSDGDKITNGVDPEASNPAKNRQKLLNLLSKVKKPLITVAPGIENGKDASQSLSIVSRDKTVSEIVSSKFSSKNFVSIDENDRSNEPEILSPSAKEEDSLSLRICLPRSAIARTPQTSRKTIHKKKHTRLKRDKIKSLVVSVPLNLIRLKSSQVPTTATEITSCVVSIPIAYYSQRHLRQSGKVIESTPLKSTGHIQAGKIEPQPVKKSPHKIEDKESEKMDIDVIFPPAVVELDDVKNVPAVVEEESLPELHKIFNGECFSGTLTSRNDVTSVMILPYVYIDGVTDDWSDIS